MKAFAFVLLCALAAVQGRYHGLETTRSAAALGENPYVVHLRIAVSTSGLLQTCVGTLINEYWVLSTASCLSDARFVWIRYGTVNVINPSLVTESGQAAVRVHPDSDVALLTTNRPISPTDNIAPISPVGEVSDSATLCGYGEVDGAPGEVLSCNEVDVSEEADGSLLVSGVEASRFDVGAPLVNDGAQFGVLVAASGESLATAQFRDWFRQESGFDFNSEAVSFVQ